VGEAVKVGGCIVEVGIGVEGISVGVTTVPQPASQILTHIKRKVKDNILFIRRTYQSICRIPPIQANTWCANGVADGLLLRIRFI
jgi:hypothetical protein